MGIIVDIIIIAIIALSIFLGYRKGLIELAIKLCAFVIAILITLILYKPVSNLIINTTSIDETIENSILEKANDVMEGEEDEELSEETNPASTEELSEETNPASTEELSEETNPASTEELSEEIKQEAREGLLPEAARGLSVNIVRGGVIIILYVLVRIALRFVTALANLVAKLPILKQFNKAGGAIYGALRGILIIYVCLIIISIFGQINPENEIHQNIEQSTLGKTMYENNILDVFFK